MRDGEPSDGVTTCVTTSGLCETNEVLSSEVSSDALTVVAAADSDTTKVLAGVGVGVPAAPPGVPPGAGLADIEVPSVDAAIDWLAEGDNPDCARPVDCGGDELLIIGEAVGEEDKEESEVKVTTVEREDRVAKDIGRIWGQRGGGVLFPLSQSIGRMV